MDVCVRDLTNPGMVDVPALIKTNSLHHSWTEEEEEDDVLIYGGVRLVPAEHLTPFPCGLFHKLQVHALIHQDCLNDSPVPTNTV